MGATPCILPGSTGLIHTSHGGSSWSRIGVKAIHYNTQLAHMAGSFGFFKYSSIITEMKVWDPLYMLSTVSLLDESLFRDNTSWHLQ